MVAFTEWRRMNKKEGEEVKKTVILLTVLNKKNILIIIKESVK